jgi:hypothetical protein
MSASTITRPVRSKDEIAKSLAQWIAHRDQLDAWTGNVDWSPNRLFAEALMALLKSDETPRS